MLKRAPLAGSYAHACSRHHPLHTAQVPRHNQGHTQLALSADARQLAHHALISLAGVEVEVRMGSFCGEDLGGRIYANPNQ